MSKKRSAPRYAQPSLGYAGYTLSPASMTRAEMLVWIQGTRAALQKKMQRERAYLDRRAARGISTPTDEAYAQDQQLEAELIALLDAFEHHLKEVP